MAAYQDNQAIFENIPEGSGFRIAVVCAEWNKEITDKLLTGCTEVLQKSGAEVVKSVVPGTFELSFAAQYWANDLQVDAIITLGCVIKGETPHFDFICNASANGITQVSLSSGKPVVFGVLTTLNLDQANERAGGKHGHKGKEAAITALKLLHSFK